MNFCGQNYLWFVYEKWHVCPSCRIEIKKFLHLMCFSCQMHCSTKNFINFLAEFIVNQLREWQRSEAINQANTICSDFFSFPPRPPFTSTVNTWKSTVFNLWLTNIWPGRSRYFFNLGNYVIDCCISICPYLRGRPRSQYKVQIVPWQVVQISLKAIIKKPKVKGNPTTRDRRSINQLWLLVQTCRRQKGVNY